MGAIISSQHKPIPNDGKPIPDGGKVVSVHSLDDWNAKFQSSKTSNKLVVVDFSAAWCGPCKMIEPTFQSYASKFEDAEFIKIDVDELPDVAKEFEVDAMPTFVLFKNGKELARIVGSDKDELKRMIQNHK